MCRGFESQAEQHRQKATRTWLSKSLKPDSLLGIHPSHPTSHLDCANPHRAHQAHRAGRTATRYPLLFCHGQPTAAHLHPVPSCIHASATIVKLSNPSFFSSAARVRRRSPVCLQRLPADPLLPSGTSLRCFLANIPSPNHFSFDHVRQLMLPEDLASAERMGRWRL